MNLYRIIPFLLIFLSCRKDNMFDCFTSRGPEITQVRKLGEFRVAEVSSNIDVLIRQGSEYRVEITAGQNLMKNILTTVKGNTLTIDDVNTCNFVRGYKKIIRVSITLPYLEKILNEGVGTVTCENFAQDTLVARAESSGDIRISGVFNEVRTSSHGNGDIYLEGSSNSFYVYAYGTNYLHAEGLTVRNSIFVETLSIGNCYVNCEGLNSFAYNIWSEGNVYYTGNPVHTADYSDGTGKGKAIKSD
jgi:hypothetical protein